MKFAEGVQTRVRQMGGEEMDHPCDLISESFKEYLVARIPILKLLAETSSS
jgi:hypothetical protein